MYLSGTEKMVFKNFPQKYIYLLCKHTEVLSKIPEGSS